MQSTTRSVDAVGGVVVAKTMASGGTMSPSASVGGKAFSTVVNGGRRKRKVFPGPSTYLTTGKKLCSSTNAIAKPTVVVAKGGGGLTMKKKDSIIDAGDTSMVDAANLLTNFSFFAHMPSQHSPSAKPLAHSNQQQPAPVLQWATRRIRSGRTRPAESPSNEVSVSHAGTPDNNPSPILQPLQQQQQISECSSCPAGDSLQSVATLVKVEEEALCSSTVVEVEGQEQEVEEQEQEQEQKKQNNRCPGDLERLHKLVSDSSNEFPKLDSPADSPSSPLPSLSRTAEFASVCGVPKFEGSHNGRSAFQRVVPIRPVKKPAVCRKLKVEEKTFEALNPVQADVKHMSRKKSRPMGEAGQQQQQQLAAVKIEEPDAFCTLALGPRLVSAEEEEEVKRDEEKMSIIIPDAVAVEEKTTDLVFIKLESKLSGRLGQRTGKPKLALSESEKEARKQRRVQANRESARQTIRRKQVMCEELSRRSQHLSIENETFRKDLELLRQKHKDLSEMNVHLTDEVARAAANREPRSASVAPLSVEKPPLGGSVQYQFPLHQFGGLPFPPSSYLWAIALAHAAQAAGLQSGDMNTGEMDYAPALAAAAAATGLGNNLAPEFRNMGTGSEGQSSVLPPFFSQQPVSSVANTLPSSSAATRAPFSSLTRSISLPVAPADASFSLVASEDGLRSGRPLASYRSGDFADSVHLSRDLMRNVGKCDTAHQATGFNGRKNYFNMTAGSQNGMGATGVGSMPMQKSGEGSRLPMSNASGQYISRSHSLAALRAPSSKMAHARYSSFGAGGMSMVQERPTMRESEAQRAATAAAAATEARRRRRELTRSKSLQHRQAPRLAEPSAS